MSHNCPGRSNEGQSRMVALYESHEELNSLFNDGFMRKYTNYESFETFKFAGAVFINWNSDFVVGDRMAFDACVKGKTQFKCWEHMYQTALAEKNAVAGTNL